MNEEIKKAVEVLTAGGLILYPTDTIWGIGCDATNEEAVRKIYSLKQRIDTKALLVLLDSTAKLDYYIQDVPDIALDLIDVADKPLTIIYDNARNVAPSIIAQDGSLAIRITADAFSHELCKRFRKAIVATSANISGQLAPISFAQISTEIKNGVDYCVNYQQNERMKNQASEIIKLGSNGQIEVIRS